MPFPAGRPMAASGRGCGEIREPAPASAIGVSEAGERPVSVAAFFPIYIRR